MLRADLIRPRLTIRGETIRPKQLAASYHYLTIAQELTALYGHYVGQSRGALEGAIRAYEGDSLDYPIIRGLAAVIEGSCTFGNNPPIDPVKLRTAIFQQGPVTGKQDLFNQATRGAVMREAAMQYGLTTDQLEAALFADLAEEQILLDCGDPLPPADLIARYNLEVARGLLYWAREVRIVIQDTYKDVFKYIKLFKLMHTIQQAEAGGYHITLHGPISPFVKSTIRYGLQFCQIFAGAFVV